MMKLEEISDTLSSNAKLVNKKQTELAGHDIEILIDIVIKLQNINNDKLVLSLLYELDSLLGVDGSVLGIHNPESNKNDYIVATIDKDLMPEFNRCTYSEIKNCSVFFENHGEKFCSFLYLKCKDNNLQIRQKKILKIILPYLFSCAIRLYKLSRKLLVFGLTSRELEVIQWIIAGKDNWSISKILGVSERTIKFHNCNIYRKLGVSTKAEAICLYTGLIRGENVQGD